MMLGEIWNAITWNKKTFHSVLPLSYVWGDGEKHVMLHAQNEKEVTH